VDLSSRGSFYLGMMAWCQGASGRKEQARETLGELERRAAPGYVSPLFRAIASRELDDPERTRALLEEAFAERASLLSLLDMPFNRKLQAEPLMQDLRRRLFVTNAS
jgi:hypothetical protein